MIEQVARATLGVLGCFLEIHTLPLPPSFLDFIVECNCTFVSQRSRILVSHIKEDESHGTGIRHELFPPWRFFLYAADQASEWNGDGMRWDEME
jgi:hypothetical protein